MEIMESLLVTKKRKVRFVCIYRPEPSDKNHYTMTEYYDEFSEIMAHYNMLSDELVVLGDFNFHVNKPHKSDVKEFMSILEANNLTNWVHEPTHISGNTLDLIITREKSSIVAWHKVDEQISDHNNILFRLNIVRPPCPKKKIAFRRLKAVNMEELKWDVSIAMNDVQSFCDYNTTDGLQNIVEEYNGKLREVLDKHAPLIKKEIPLRKPTPWSSDEICGEQQIRRRLE